MKPYSKIALSLVAVVVSVAGGSSRAEAFWGHHRRVTTAYSIPSVPVMTVPAYAMAQPVVVGRPVIVVAPVIAGYAPTPSPVYPVAPATFAPTTTYYPPVTTYYAPAPVATYYAPAPVTTYYAPLPVVAPPRVIFVP